MAARWLAAAAAALLLLAGAAWLGRRLAAPRTVAAGTPRQITSSAGWEAQPAISPDGEFVAYVAGDELGVDLWLIDARGGTPLRLTHDEAVERRPAWLPDGSALLFSAEADGRRSVWRVPRLGGPATLVVQDADDPAPSPDGLRLAFTRAGPTGSLRIHVAPMQDAARATMRTMDGLGFWDHERPVWSPDSARIAFHDFRHVWVLPAEEGPARRVSREPHTDTDPAWSAAGEALYVSSYRDGNVALWRLGVDADEEVRLTIGTGPEVQPSVSRDGARLAYSTFDERRELALHDLASGARGRIAGGRYLLNPGFLPDGGGLLYVSDRAGRFDLWLQRLEGVRPSGEPRRLTDLAGSVARPAVSPDGRWIAVHRVVDGRRDIWVLGRDGGGAHPFTDDPAADFEPAWSPAGDRIAFVSERGGAAALWVAGVRDGRRAGEPRLLHAPPGKCLHPAWSPDGSRIALVVEAEGTAEVALVAADGALEPRMATRGAGARSVRWDASTGELVVAGTWGASLVALRRLAADGGEPRPFGADVRFGAATALGDFALSSDGRSLAVVEEIATGDIWVLQGETGTY